MDDPKLLSFSHNFSTESLAAMTPDSLSPTSLVMLLF